MKIIRCVSAFHVMYHISCHYPLSTNAISILLQHWYCAVKWYQYYYIKVFPIKRELENNDKMTNLLIELSRTQSSQYVIDLVYRSTFFSPRIHKLLMF